MKRAMRCDKLAIAGLSATLKLYEDPDKALRDIPTLRLLSRSREELTLLADRILPNIRDKFKGTAEVKLVSCFSQIGGGSLPNEQLPSVGISIQKRTKKRSGVFSETLAQKLRCLPVPIIGRIHKGALLLDLRCLEDEELFIKQFQSLEISVDIQ